MFRKDISLCEAPFAWYRHPNVRGLYYSDFCLDSQKYELRREISLIFEFWIFWDVIYLLNTPHLVRKSVLRKSKSQKLAKFPAFSVFLTIQAEITVV